ncbi:preprotein translocase subunit SecY [Fructilactobacillus florum]|uniref:preprotein translocase subunit SecY n=1 Tax=Fructilactobacillus florum TaxID=640331 RepID=UPI00028CB86C|nr:preprotein translocase subunit SecY [Fructilactobacillus florum]EKK20619.1 Preprotein translocase subunit SecY [Fructilactobacillus florum 2F]
MKFFRQHDLLQRGLVMFLLLAILLIGQAIILPGINPEIAHATLAKRTYLGLLGISVGGQFKLPTIFTLGLGPYMTGLIVWQAISALDLEGINRLSLSQTGYLQKIITLVLAILQSSQIVRYLQPALVSGTQIGGFSFNKTFVSASAMLILIAGSMLTVFLGEFNADKGLGGISVLILPGIILGLPQLLQKGWKLHHYPLTHYHLLVAAGLTLLVVIIFIMLLQIELRIPVQNPFLIDAGRQSYLPFRLLVAGSMPFMFSATIFTLPRSIFKSSLDHNGGHWLLQLTNPQTGIGILMYGIVLMFLSYAFGLITIQPLKLAKQMKENDEYLINVFPGVYTSRYLMQRFLGMATIGGFCLVGLGVTPLIIGLYAPGFENFTLYFGSVVILITIMQSLIDQVRALYTRQQYQIF